MKLRGELYEIGEIVEVKDFKRRSFVLMTNDKGYTHYITLEFFNNQCDLLDKNEFRKGARVVVDFSVNGRKYNKDGQDKYFNTLQAWRLAIDTSEE
jgi:single-stranded DNA-binding protein